MTASTAELRHEQRKDWEDEWPFTVERIGLHLLFPDKRYQRDVIDGFVAAKALVFDPTLVGTLDVAAREDGRYAILDGLQRRSICEKVGKKTSWCSVYRDMTIADEAQHFADKNAERRNMHPYYRLRARAVAGQPGPKEIIRIAKDAGYKLSASSRVKGAIVAIGAVEEVYEYRSLVRPEGALAPTLDTIRDAWEGRDGALEGTIIRAVGRVWKAYADEEIDFDHLVETLAGSGPKKILGFALDRYMTSKNPKAYLAAQEIVTLYNRKKRKGGKLPLPYLQRDRT